MTEVWYRAVVVAVLLGCGGGDEPATARGDGAAISIEPMKASLAWEAATRGADTPLEVHLEHVGPLHADCAAGSEVACVTFTMAYGTAASLAQGDRARAAPILDRGCSGGDKLQCALACEALDDPGGTSKETPKAIDELMKLCRGGMAFACTRAAAIRLGSGLAVPSLDEARARAFIEKACSDEVLVGCAMRVYLSGAIPPPHEFAGSEPHRTRVRACEIGDISACLEIVKLVTPAPPVEHPDTPPAPDRAARARASAVARAGTARGLELWRAGCKGGMTQWCGPLAELENALAALEGLPR